MIWDARFETSAPHERHIKSAALRASRGGYAPAIEVHVLLLPFCLPCKTMWCRLLN